MQKWHEEWLKSLGMPETVKFSIQELNRAVNQSGLAAASALPALTALASGYHAFSEAERAALPLTHELESAILRMAEGQRELFTEIVSGQLPAMRRLELEQARQLDAARREIAMMHEKVAQHKATRAEEERLEEQYTELVVTQAKLRQEAQKRDTEEQAEGLAVAAAGLLGRLGLRKAEAIVEAGVEIAKAYACYGDHDYWGAAQHLISAADWGIVAGQSTGAGGGGGGPAPSAGVRGGFSGPTAPGATGTVTPMTPGLTSIGGPAPGGRAINVHVYGPYEEATHIATVLNDLTERRGGKLISSRTIAPPKAGR
jgi:hypothetical protein